MKISAHLEQIQEKLPTWFKMRKDPNSIGAQFLNVMGLGMDDIHEVLEYAYHQQFLQTASLEQVDIVYKASIPALNGNMTLEFNSAHYLLQEASSLERFLTSLKTDALNHREIFYDHPYYIDYERNLVYVRNGYDKDTQYPEGKLMLKAYNLEGTQVMEAALKLNIHHIWNFFDEFGLLLDTPRLYGEKNIDYKRRLYEVFERPANSSEQGLYNGIARELGLIKEVPWRNGGMDFIIKEARVLLGSVKVDGEPYPADMIEVDASGRTILAAEAIFENMERTVSYIAGLTMHEFHNKDDQAFQRELFDMDGRATSVLQYYVDIINSKVPITWNHFVWGVGFWDVASPDMSGYGFVPTFYDAEISSWKRYKS